MILTPQGKSPAGSWGTPGNALPGPQRQAHQRLLVLGEKKILGSLLIKEPQERRTFLEWFGLVRITWTLLGVAEPFGQRDLNSRGWNCCLLL